MNTGEYPELVRALFRLLEHDIQRLGAICDVEREFMRSKAPFNGCFTHATHQHQKHAGIRQRFAVDYDNRGVWDV